MTDTSELPLNHLRQATERFLSVLRDGDLAAPVPGCTPWTLTDLAHHLAGVHRWARTAVLESRAEKEPLSDAPTSRDELLALVREQADALIDALRSTGPDTPCWTFGPAPHRAAFWVRRQIHETTMHARDAETAAGRTPTPLPDDLAQDGIDELVTMFFPRQARLGRIAPLTGAVAIETGSRRWVLVGDGTTNTDRVDAALRGSAETLLLLLWHRTALDGCGVTIDGDHAAVQRMLKTALTP